jgi:hypothetical protein
VSDERPVLPPDPAGTQPKVEPASLLPARLPEPEPDPEPTLPVVLEPDAGAEVGTPIARRHAPHAARFQFLLGALLAIGLCSIAAVVLLAGGAGREEDRAAGWSPWRPTEGGREGAQQIADHVAQQYRLPSGDQLLYVQAQDLEVEELPLRVVVRDGEDGGIREAEGDGVMYRMCGLGPACTISQGRPSVRRGFLVAREALELALYSFRYLDVEQVVVTRPPARAQPGADSGLAFHFRRDDVAPVLERPLRSTLVSPPPSVQTVRRSPDAPLVDRLSQPGIGAFTFRLAQAGQGSDVFLVLEPPQPEGGSTGGSAEPSRTTPRR